MGYDKVNESELRKDIYDVKFRMIKDGENLDHYRIAMAKDLTKKGDLNKAAKILGVYENTKFMDSFIHSIYVKNHDILWGIGFAAILGKEEKLQEDIDEYIKQRRKEYIKQRSADNKYM